MLTALASSPLSRLRRVCAWLAIVALVSSCVAAPAPQTIRVLFVGNSLTYYNDLPGMVRTLYQSTAPHRAMEWEMLASGGALMREHLDAGHLASIFAAQHFDVVVLQELGGFPSCPADFRGCSDSPQALREAVALVRRAGARPILFGTWQPDPGLQPDLSLETARMAADLKVEVADVGGAIHAFDARGTPKTLDGTGHLSVEGSWLAAMVLVRSITGSALPAAAPAPLCEADWTGRGLSENSLASRQVQPPTKCFSLPDSLFNQFRRVAGAQ